MVLVQSQFATFSTHEAFVVGLLRDHQIPILSPVGIIAVVPIHPVRIALHFTLGSFEEELVVLTLIQLGHLLEHLLIVKDGLRDVPTGT